MIYKEKGNKKQKGNKSHGIYFLIMVISLYLILFIFQQENIHKSLKASGILLIHIIPILVLVIFFMGIINYFVESKKVSKYMGKKSGIKGWSLAISTGILSHGPIYIWYPFLKELRDQGMRSGLIAVFLYNRSIKIPLLPLMIYYFGPIFASVLFVYMIIASIIEGKIIEKIENHSKRI